MIVDIVLDLCNTCLPQALTGARYTRLYGRPSFTKSVWCLQVAGWADNDDPRWACLWDCTKDPAVFNFVRHLLAPLPELRLQAMFSAAFMHQSYNGVSHASLLEMLLPLEPFSAPAKPLAGNEAGVVLSNGIAFVPVPGMATVLWDPHNPIVNTITGSVYRYG